MMGFDTLSEVELCEKISRLEHENKVLREQFINVVMAVGLQNQPRLIETIKSATETVESLNKEKK